MIVIFLLVTIFISFIHAMEELEIEGKGKHGWARSLPTKRFYNKFTKFIVGKELTMYHVYMLLRIFLFYHLIFIFKTWTIQLELVVLSGISFYFVSEDFIWFLLNPNYCLKNFNKKSISWHKRWFCGLPISYIWGMIIGTGLLIIGSVG